MNLQQPTTNDQQTTNVQRPMPFGLGVGGWKFVGRWWLVVGCSAAGGCCPELQRGRDEYNAAVALRTADPAAAEARLNSAREHLRSGLEKCDPSPPERFRALLLLARVELRAGDLPAAKRILARLHETVRRDGLTGSGSDDATILDLLEAETNILEADTVRSSPAPDPAEILNLLSNAEAPLRRVISREPSGGARDLALLWLAQARFEKAKMMELHDETTRTAHLTAAGAELDGLAKDMADRAPEHPDLLREYEELKTKVAEERERVQKALGR